VCLGETGLSSCIYPGMGTGAVTWGVIPSPSALAPVHLLGTSSTGSSEATSVTWSVPQLLASSLAQPPLFAQASSGLNAPSGATPLPYSLSPATEPFPQKLVEKVRSGQFVEMRELLSDNISLLQQLDTVSMQCLPVLPGVLKPRLREVNTLASWVYCFPAYLAIRSSDQATIDMLAYARLVIREAQRHGGVGWLDYDRVFRQQAALDGAIQWNSIHPGIQAATLTGRTAKPGVFCTLCRESDHSAGACALAYLQPSATPPLRAAPPTQRAAAQKQYASPRKDSICYSWNAGRCRFPGSCSFRHECLQCHQSHMVQDCPQAKAKNDGRNPIQGRPSTSGRSGN
jgi:hypothetical protein